jgi:hypothetical protein
MVDVYSWLYFNKRKVLSGCALAVTLLLVLMLFIWSNHSTKEALKEYERPPAPIHKRALPWDPHIIPY